jgi:hypothetical protein
MRDSRLTTHEYLSALFHEGMIEAVKESLFDEELKTFLRAQEFILGQCRLFTQFER